MSYVGGTTMNSPAETPFYHAEKCPCASKHCGYWLVSPVADVQGVSFTEKQARLVAAVLNALDEITVSSE